MGWGLVMPAPLSRDLRERIVAAIRDGSSMRGAAARFFVSPSSAIKLMARVRASGSVAPARYGGHRRPVLAPHEKALRSLVSERPEMDNLAAHKMAGISEAIAAAGASLLYLPPYSPDLNPIEQFFAKLKALLRKAAARTKEVLWQTAGQLLDLVPTAECRSYLANAGYEPT